MRGSYQLREWEETRVKNLIAKAIKDLKEYEIDKIDFTREDVNPYNLLTRIPYWKRETLIFEDLEVFNNELSQ